MSSDPLLLLSQQRIIKASLDIERGLISLPGGGPCIEILKRLRDRAADSLAALAVADPERPAEIRTLQNEVKRYDEWLGWLRDIIAEARVNEQNLSEQDREETIDLLLQTEEGTRQARALGLIDDVSDD